MRLFSPVAITSLTALGLVQIASANDLPRKAPAAPVVAPAYNWTGFYIGGNVGGGWGSRDVSFAPNDPGTQFLFLSGAPPPSSFDINGVPGGLQLGYNWQFDRNWLLGVETDFNGSGLKGSTLSPGTLGIGPNLFPFMVNADEHIKWFGTVRARLGFLPTGYLLAYITGGFAYGQVERTVTLNSPAGIGTGGFSFDCVSASLNCFSGSSSSTRIGWTVGGGLEYAIWPRWTLKAEYLYVSLDSDSNLTATALAAFPSNPAPASFNANYSRANFNVARAGLNYRF
jgi:outer membrane immunogenic protein